MNQMIIDVLDNIIDFAKQGINDCVLCENIKEVKNLNTILTAELNSAKDRIKYLEKELVSATNRIKSE